MAQEIMDNSVQDGETTHGDNPELYEFKIALGKAFGGHVSTGSPFWRRDVIRFAERLMRERSQLRKLQATVITITESRELMGEVLHLPLTTSRETDAWRAKHG